MNVSCEVKNLEDKLSELQQKIRKLEIENEQQKMTISTYRRSAIKLLEKRKSDDEVLVTCTPEEFCDIHETIIDHALEYDKEKHGFTMDDICDQDFTIRWMGMETTMLFGADTTDLLISAIRELNEVYQ